VAGKISLRTRDPHVERLGRRRVLVEPVVYPSGIRIVEFPTLVWESISSIYLLMYQFNQVPTLA